jgi:hypothetical protein
MGILSDVFIARASEITRETFERGPAERFPTVEGKGLLPDSFAELWRVLDAKTAEPFARHWIVNGASPDSECQIFSLPPVFVACVAEASELALSQAKTAWYYHGKPPPADPLDGIVKDWFDEFVELLKNAHEQEISAFVWVST